MVWSSSALHTLGWPKEVIGDLMGWYERLARYFPSNEMKDRQQMEDLLKEHERYHKWESSEYVVTYAEFSTFIFIDYLLVNAQRRGQGIGSQILDRFKHWGKILIVEVEPPDVGQPEAAKRVAFYEKNGFRLAKNIAYTRSEADGTPYSLDIYYWSPDPVSETVILGQMAQICRQIHNFKALKYYGRLVADPEETLDWKATP